MKNQNKAASINQIKTEKSSLQFTRTTLAGHVAGSMNAAHILPIHYFETLPNQPLDELKYHGSFKLLTPKSPVYQNLNVTFITVKVPYGKIWKDWAKFQAYKGGVNEEKIDEVPNYGGKQIPWIEMDGAENTMILSNTSAWRDSSTSRFIPRTIGVGGDFDNRMGIMPKGSILPLRANRVAWNLCFMDKRYEVPLQTYDGNTVSETEWQSYMPDTATKLHYLKQRNKLPDSYYTNYRTDLQGIETNTPDLSNPETALMKWIKWENETDFARTTAQDEMKIDEEIIAELYGGAPALENQVEIIGKVTQPLNYSAVTQSAYNSNNEIDENYRTMGTQGAYSYTQFNGLPLFKNRKFKEPCVILVYACVWADVIYTSAFDRMDLNVSILDRYRPDLAAQKEDVIYAIENGTNFYSKYQEETRMSEISGFKRKFSEYFKMRNSINSDAVYESILQYIGREEIDEEQNAEKKIQGSILAESSKEYLTNYTYNFYETTRYTTAISKILSYTDVTYYVEENLFTKDFWLDYTDLIINRNLAVPGDVYTLIYEPTGGGAARESDCVINGQNQIQHGGIVLLQTRLPISKAIEENYTEYGEH